MYYLEDKLFIGHVIQAQKPPKGVTVAWSLSKLVNMFPETIYIGNSNWVFDIRKNKEYWYVCYLKLVNNRVSNNGAAYFCCHKDIFEACINVAEWLSSKDYKLNNIK